MLPISAARRLRIPGYSIMAMTLVQVIVEFWIRAYPTRLSSPAWRLGLINTSGGAVGTALLALFVIFAIAVAAEDSAGAYVVSSLSALAAPLCLLALGTFTLDALQMKSQVQASLADGYGIATTWVVARLLISATLFALLALSALRAAKTRRTVASPHSEKGAVVLVGAARTVAAVGSTAARRGAEPQT